MACTFAGYQVREMMLDPRVMALALGGHVRGCNVLAPGPGHSRADRSLSIKIDPSARDGFIVHSFTGDPTSRCREHVRTALNLSGSERQRWQSSSRRQPPSETALHDSSQRSAFALRLWNEAVDPRGTIAASYLASRGLTLDDAIAGDVIRFHPHLKLEGSRVGGMVALFRDIASNEPCGLHRTFLDSAGRKLTRKMLGRAKGAAIKLDADEHVTLGLHIGEGLETGLAARLAGFRPVWAVGSASAIATFPVPPGIEAIAVLGEINDGGANHRAAQTCATRWIEVGQEAFIVTPLSGNDLNDVLREVTL
jgi:Toprim domain-containing protein